MWICTCCDLPDEFSSVVAALDQQMSPNGQILGRIHPEHMGLHALLCAWTQAKWKLGVQQRGGFPWARVDQSEGGDQKVWEQCGQRRTICQRVKGWGKTGTQRRLCSTYEVLGRIRGKGGRCSGHQGGGGEEKHMTHRFWFCEYFPNECDVMLQILNDSYGNTECSQILGQNTPGEDRSAPF